MCIRRVAILRRHLDPCDANAGAHLFGRFTSGKASSSIQGQIRYRNALRLPNAQHCGSQIRHHCEPAAANHGTAAGRVRSGLPRSGALFDRGTRGFLSHHTNLVYPIYILFGFFHVSLMYICKNSPSAASPGTGWPTPTRIRRPLVCKPAHDRLTCSARRTTALGHSDEEEPDAGGGLS